MATKDISDRLVVEAYARHASTATSVPAWLAEQTGQCEKVCYRAMERAARRGLIDYGVSLRTGWLTEAGSALLETADT